LISCNFDPDTAKMPLDIGEPIYGTVVPNFTEFMAPGKQFKASLLGTN
jgi:hypothetical protein